MTQERLVEGGMGCRKGEGHVLSPRGLLPYIRVCAAQRGHVFETLEQCIIIKPFSKTGCDINKRMKASK